MGKKAPTKAVEDEKPKDNDKAEEKEVEEKEVEEKEAEEKEEEEKEAEEKEEVEDEEEVKPVENGVKDKKGKKKGADSKKSEKEKGGKKKDEEEGDKKKDKEEGDKKKDKDGDKKKEKDGGESSEEELGTLEKPIEILTNKRDRKNTERFVPQKLEKKDDDDVDYAEGKGVVLKDIPFVKHQIREADAEDLEVIHKLMYRKSAKQHLLKRNILNFQGFPFDKEHKFYKAAQNMADRLTLAGVRWINGTLGLLKSKEREEMTDALMEFITEPKDLELPIPVKKTAPKAQKSSRRGKRTPKRAAKDPSKKVEDSDDDEDVSEASSDEEESEAEEKPAKSPAKKTTKKKATPVKISLPSKKRGKRKSAPSAPSESDSDEDDEPLVKKKKATPSDAELKKAVSSILKDADLEEVTMKNVVRQVYDRYPSFDLSSRKDYIKSTVKQMIS